MILAMKLISLAFDLDSGAVRDTPGICHYSGYLFHVGSVLFGPWISFHDYMAAVSQPSERIFVSLSPWHILLIFTRCFIKVPCIIYHIFAVLPTNC